MVIGTRRSRPALFSAMNRNGAMPRNPWNAILSYPLADDKKEKASNGFHVLPCMRE